VRCRSACWYRSPTNKSFEGMCFCHTDQLWMPQPDSAVDSARLVWPCEDAASCSYNGVCPQGSPTAQCACHPGWRGPSCGELDLQPVDKAKLGYRALATDGTNVSSWGMPALYDAASAKWHGWASEMVHGCGINAWETNSQIVHTVSDTPLGPYRKVVGDNAVVWPAFAHEPDVVRGPAGEWVMMYSAYPYTPSELNKSVCVSCKDGTTPPQGTPGCPFQRGTPKSLGHTFKQMLAVATSPDGPWREFEISQLTGTNSHYAMRLSCLVLLLSRYASTMSARCRCFAADVDWQTHAHAKQKHTLACARARAHTHTLPCPHTPRASLSLLSTPQVPWDWNTALTINSDGSAVALIRAGYTWHADNYTDPATWHAVGLPPGGSGHPSVYPRWLCG
jgi:hypothetical protein